MAQRRLYSDIIQGFLEYTGNTLGVNNFNTTIDITNHTQANPPPITSGALLPLSNWRNCSSEATLRGLTGSTVVGAYLAWMSTPSPNAGGDSASNQDASITFTTPLTSATIAPNPAWSQGFLFINLQFNIRVADVTSLVSAAGVGTYRVTGVPCATNLCGWTLMVVWRNTTFQPRYISVDTFADFLNAGGLLQLPVSGFITSSSGNQKGRAALVAGTTESSTISGPVQFGRTTSSLSTLSGPRNPASAFFQSQICVANSESALVGQLDTSGTFGSNNAPLGSSTGSDLRRWLYDITNVDISAGLTVNQTSGLFQFGPANNGYMAYSIGLQIDVKSPVLNTTKFVDKSAADVGDTLTYTLVVSNTGNFDTDNLIIIDTIPSGTSFISGTVKVDGTTVPGASPVPPGFNAGAITVGQTKTITFNITPIASSAFTTINNRFGTGYSYSPGGGITLNGSTSSNTVSTFISGKAIVPNTKLVNKNFANVGDIITYTIILSNSGSTSANNLILKDTIPNDTTFLTNSLTLNGVTVNGASPAPPSGFVVGTIAANRPATVTFQVRVNTIPSPNPIPNTSMISYSYDTTIPNGVSVLNESNRVNTQVNNASLSGITKLVDKRFATCGESINYTIVIPNTGNVTAQNVIFKDTIPNGTVLVPSSVFVNNVSSPGANPNIGVTIPNIPPGTTSTLTFSVVVQC